MILTNDLAEHASTLVAIIGSMFVIVLALVSYAWKGLRDDLKGLREDVIAIRESVADGLEKSTRMQEERWIRHEAMHQEARRLMMGQESRLSHIEGKANAHGTWKQE